MSVPNEYSIFCTKCDCYNVSDIACGDCVEEIKKKAHQAGIDEAVEIVEKEKARWNGNGEYYANVTEALDNTIKALSVKDKMEND